MAYDYIAAQGRAHRQIVRFNGGKENNAKLRRGATDRNCTAAILDYSPREAQLRLDGARRMLISAKGLDIAPDHEQDMLLFTPTGELFRIVSPVLGPRPAGVPIFYDCEVMYDSRPV